MNKPIIELTHINHTYNQTLKVIDDISLTINKKDFLTFVGPSGCGKSTLFKLITKLIPNYEGQIKIKDVLLETSDESLGYMPQKDLLLPWRSLYKNVVLPLELAKKEIDKSKIEDMIELFGLKEFINHYPHQLSGGMRQRVALLRTFVMGNDIVLLDEPFAALDYLTKRKLQTWLLDVFKKLDKTVIFITHDIEEALYLSNRVVVLSNLPATIIKEYQVTNKTDLEATKKEIWSLIQ